MYGIKNNVSFPDYSYGKNSFVQRKNEAFSAEENAPAKNGAGRTDEILFSVTQNKDVTTSSLSQEAQDLLSELREKYGDYDFIVEDYETDEQASEILSRGKGEINVLITPDLLEKMASDPSEREKYESIIAGASDTFDQINSQLTEEGKNIVEKLGLTVNEDGSLNLYALLGGGARADDGGRMVKSSIISDFTDTLNSIAQLRAELLNKQKERTDKLVSDKDDSGSNLPPKSFEKIRVEGEPFNTEKDYGTLPPESFKKYEKEESPYNTEEDYGNLPPESFKRYQKEADPAADNGEKMDFSV